MCITILCVQLFATFMSMYHMPGAHGSQKKSLDSLELELQTFVNCCVDVGIEPGSSERAAGTHNQ